jgi:hypothetical protein
MDLEVRLMAVMVVTVILDLVAPLSMVRILSRIELAVVVDKMGGWLVMVVELLS